jgi:hypothetical protein
VALQVIRGQAERAIVVRPGVAMIMRVGDPNANKEKTSRKGQQKASHGVIIPRGAKAYQQEQALVNPEL